MKRSRGTIHVLRSTGCGGDDGLSTDEVAEPTDVAVDWEHDSPEQHALARVSRRWTTAAGETSLLESASLGERCRGARDKPEAERARPQHVSEERRPCRRSESGRQSKRDSVS